MTRSQNPMRALADCRHWVFDLDGTLTQAVHDFDLIRRELGIPAAEDILEHLAGLPAAEAAAGHQWLMAHERDLALGAQPAPGAVALVDALHGAGCRLGILTRNARELALATLHAIGLAHAFEPAHVLGRDEARPKPDPAGLRHFSDAWAIPPQRLAMVGDYCFDLECGRAIGATTVLVNQTRNPWPGLADVHARDCAELLQRLPR